MKRVATALVLGSLLPVSLAGQGNSAQGERPATFDLAEIHPSASSPQQAMRGGVPRDGVYRLRKATMVDLIRVAYGVDEDKVTGGPNWVELDRFDVTAKVPPGTNRDTVRPMMQALLAERFNLAVRQESKAFPSNVLVAGPSPKLKEARGDTPSNCQQNIEPPLPGRSLTIVFSCKSTTMGTFVERLNSMAGPELKVTDGTGLAGSWDFEFRLTPNLTNVTSTASLFASAAVSDALDKSLGLKLEARSVSLPTVFIERTNRVPTPNTPAAVAAFPSNDTLEFEVSDIKPSTTDRQTRQVLPTGQFTATGVTLRMLVGLGWLTEDPTQIIGPKGLDEKKYDVIAKFSSRPVDPQEIDTDDIAVMMRKMLVERFHLKSHREDRVLDAPTLVASGTPRLTKADPDSRTKCSQGSAPRPSTGSGPSVPMFQITCQNVTLGEFAERLQRLSLSDFKLPVMDATQIEGRYNFAVSFAPEQLTRSLTQAISNARASAAASGATLPADLSDPMGGLTLSQALEKQYGLKVEMRKRPVSVLVVDSLDDKPTDN